MSDSVYITQKYEAYFTNVSFCEFLRKTIANISSFLKQVVCADTDVINTSYQDKSGDVGILAASDVVHILHTPAFKLNNDCKLTMKLHYPTDRIERRQQHCFSVLHVMSNEFTITKLETSQCVVDGDTVTIPVRSFTG